jgi:hypothetical protein
VRAAVYNSNDSSPQWTFADGDTSLGLNFGVAAATPTFGVFQGNLYSSWVEPAPGELRVSVGR